MAPVVREGGVNIGHGELRVSGDDVPGRHARAFVPKNDVPHSDAMADNPRFTAADAGGRLNVARSHPNGIGDTGCHFRAFELFSCHSASSSNSLPVSCLVNRITAGRANEGSREWLSEFLAFHWNSKGIQRHLVIVASSIQRMQAGTGFSSAAE